MWFKLSPSVFVLESGQEKDKHLLFAVGLEELKKGVNGHHYIIIVLPFRAENMEQVQMVYSYLASNDP
jgi:hypothetical protein